VQHKNNYFEEHRVHGDAQCLLVAAPLAKFGQCSHIGKIYPPATALPDLPQGNKYMPNCCIIGGGSGSGVLLDYWHERTTWFFGFVFGSAGHPLTLFFWSETARLQIGLWRKIRVNPNYLGFFLLLPPLPQMRNGGILLAHLSLPTDIPINPSGWLKFK
jgi:hypothetical protein